MRRLRPILNCFLLVGMMLIILGVGVPALLPPGTCTDMDGSPSRMDHSCGSLPAWARPIYLYGDISCHQQADSSFSLKSNQLPYCIRDLFVYLGGTLGLAFWLCWPGHMFRRPIRDRLLRASRGGVLLLIGALAVLPMFLDALVFRGNMSWSCTTASRAVTGILGGIGLSCLWVRLWDVLLGQMEVPVQWARTHFQQSG
jgi:uncharacterized membrane protein